VQTGIGPVSVRIPKVFVKKHTGDISVSGPGAALCAQNQRGSALPWPLPKGIFQWRNGRGPQGLLALMPLVYQPNTSQRLKRRLDPRIRRWKKEGRALGPIEPWSTSWGRTVSTAAFEGEDDKLCALGFVGFTGPWQEAVLSH